MAIDWEIKVGVHDSETLVGVLKALTRYRAKIHVEVVEYRDTEERPLIERIK